MLNIHTYIDDHKDLTNTQRELMQAYAECLLWSSYVMAENDIDDMENAEDYYDVCSDSFCESVVADCKEHIADAMSLIEQAIQQGQGYTMEQAGHDFALTRNGHGAGYWDRGLGEVGDKLSKIAEGAGNIDLYIGDDGLLYSS